MTGVARNIAFLLCIFAFGCNSQPADFRLFIKGAALPQVIFKDIELKDAAENFCRLFQEATGERLIPSQSADSGDNSGSAVINLSLYDDSEANMNFRITQKNNRMLIAGKESEDVDSGIRYFFRHFVHTEPVTEGVAGSKPVHEIAIPSGFDYAHEYAFEYREPYFPDNFLPEFRKWNNTHTLEENWGIWGHNIGKAVTITTAMHATVEGKKNEEQLCFSSIELENGLTEYIKATAIENPGQNRFMVMPYDNNLACTCDKCSAAGNTANNASPAVFSMINRLAAKFPNRQFFSTAYITTEKPPAFKLEPNAGVMVSTMNFPKGVVVEKTPRKDEIKQTFDKWKSITGKIYLWDYAVNFDNFFDAYPTVSIAQQNLKFYKSLGVTGVFMHGSEEHYSAFGSLKCYLYAQLLQDLTADIDKLTKEFYERRYPVAGEILSSYYLSQEKRAFESARQLDIYGGMRLSEKKYLDRAAFENFYSSLVAKLPSMSSAESEAIKPLLASLTFQRLELMRINGLGEGGYGNLQDNKVKVNPLADVLLNRLASLCADAEIKIINESNYTIAEYINIWRRDIMPGNYKNLGHGKRLKFVTRPDEEYSDVRLLTDGAIGFTDYYNNWVISTANEFSVEANADHVEGVHTIELNFLNDPRHNIYVPEKVTVTISGRTFEAKIPADNSKTRYKKLVSIPVTVVASDKTITIQTKKQPEFKNKSVACDEVYFK